MSNLSFKKRAEIFLRRNFFLASIVSFYRNYCGIKRNKFGFIDKSARVNFPIFVSGIENVYLYDEVQILSNSVILASDAKFIMKKLSGAAQGLTVVTGNHFPSVGEWMAYRSRDANILDSKDIIVEEDVWIAANVTLLAGVTIGRGSTVGAGSVCRNSVPPYAIVVGNPAKVIGFNFTPVEIIEHEKILYPPDDRLSLDLLENNYKKYFINRISEIKLLLKN